MMFMKPNNCLIGKKFPDWVLISFVLCNVDVLKDGRLVVASPQIFVQTICAAYFAHVCTGTVGYVFYKGIKTSTRTDDLKYVTQKTHIFYIGKVWTARCYDWKPITNVFRFVRIRNLMLKVSRNDWKTISTALCNLTLFSSRPFF